MKPGKDNEFSKEFVNGSRIVVLPDEEGNIRAFSSVSVIVIDEAARVSDNLYRTVRPMLAVSRGRMIASSTAFGQRGWFYEEYKDTTRPWKRFNITADKNPRLSAQFLEGERLKMGDRWFLQEYMNDFAQAIGSVFSPEDIAASFGRVSEEEAWADLFGGSMPAPNIVDAKALEF
jgi:hypothetical protein